MTQKDIGEALELQTAGISLLDIAHFYDVDAIALNAVFKEITEFRKLHHKCGTVLVVRESSINKLSDNRDYQ